MTIMIRETCKKRMTRWYHVCRKRWTAGLDHLVLSEAEEVDRMRRRLHIHLVLLGCNGAASFFSLAGFMDVASVAGLSTGVLFIQEVIDCVGKF